MLEATRLNAASEGLYERHVNPQWVRLLDILGMNAAYSRCEGAELFTADGRVILDFNSGYCGSIMRGTTTRALSPLWKTTQRPRPRHAAGRCARTCGQARPEALRTRQGPRQQGVLLQFRQRRRRSRHQVRPRPHQARGILAQRAGSTASPAARCL